VITRIYIDGYNLYFGCLKNTPYKWLDPVELFRTNLLIRCGVPNSRLHPDCGIKFFTAEISSKASSDPNSVNDQRAYHQALRVHCAGDLNTTKGNYSIDKVKFPKVEKDDEDKDKEPRDCTRVKVWKMEEKQSDVNVALEAVYDVVMDTSIEQVVFVTNDTDILPALKKIKYHNDLGVREPVKIGLVIPRRQHDDDRRPNKELSNIADWTISYIFEDELKRSQLPCRIASPKRAPAIKPTNWFRFPDKVAEILEILSAADVERSIPRAWNWLSKPTPIVEGLPILDVNPDQLMDHEEGLEAVKKHVLAYAEFRRGNPR